MSLIDNKNQTLQEALKDALKSSDRVDIGVGFFYFSGFEALADQLKDKKVRILVGLEVDPSLVPQISQSAKDGDVDLSKWQPRNLTKSRTALKLNYIDSFVGFMNDSDIFDSERSNKLFDLYMKKIGDGTLEIRKTVDDYHGKFYLLHNNKKLNQNGNFPGTLFFGSSNLSYRGLCGQGELNRTSKEKSEFKELEREFEEMWSDSNSISIADIKTKENFIDAIKPRIWKYITPSPYYIYIRILHELFYNEEIKSLKTANKITSGLYTDLEYQIDAVKMVIDKLNKYDGVLLADVVGLGKSIIASTVARNTDMKTVIIAPPHLRTQWEDYKEQFGIRGSIVYSSGKIKDVYKKYHEVREPIMLVLDEAHRYRNEDTNDYKLLHQICRSHPGNKIMLLTATPFNNDPKDVFALIKLFQTPGLSTIRSVDNLSMRYRELIQRYKKLRRTITKDVDQKTINEESSEIAAEQRRLIEPIIVRRSRLDLKFVTRYKEDLERQGVAFSNIRGPELIEYDLGNLYDLYAKTLNLISPAKKEKSNKRGLIGARYRPTKYVKKENLKKVIELFKKELGEETDLVTAQSNLAKFMRRLLVMRFESSRDAFRSTLETMIKSNERIENWWNIMGKVPILKKGYLPDPEDYEQKDGEFDALAEDLELLRSKKGLLEIDKSLIAPKFIDDVRHDTQLLKTIKDNWYKDNKYAGVDPKVDEIETRIKKFLKENPDRKIIIFSSYKDTVYYLYEELKKRGLDRISKYSASESSESYKQIIKSNFDASLPKNEQQNDFDILIATDALSEGFNLHRAGIVINYDIPYNPTRVIQRVGRINRINKKVFDYLDIYNCFPTVIGEEEIRIKLISTLKIKLINEVVGSDTRTLTKKEEPKTYFKDQYEKALKDDQQLSWDAPHREIYDNALKDDDLIYKVKKVPRRSRVKRRSSKNKGVIVFGKKGQNTIFTFNNNQNDAKVISAEDALPKFEAKLNEKGEPVDKNFTGVFALAKEKLFAKHELPQIKGRRFEAIKVLKIIAEDVPSSKNYCEDIITIIKTLDDLSEGALKDIAQLNLKDLKVAYKNLQKIVPETFIRNILDRARHTEDEQELLLFAEQLK